MLDDKLCSSIANVTITVQDVNDEPPVFNKRDYFVSIPENIAPGTPLPNLNMSVVDSDVVSMFLIFIYIHYFFIVNILIRVLILNFHWDYLMSQNFL